MKNIGRLLDAIDEILGPDNMVRSSVKELNRYYDSESAEHVFTLEYRVQVEPPTGISRRPDSLLNAILQSGDLDKPMAIGSRNPAATR